MNYLSNLKNEYGIYWDFLLLVLGAALPGIYGLLNKALKKIRIKVKLHNLIDLDELNILRICSANPKYNYSDIVTNVSGKKLYIGFPQEFRQVIKQNDPDFVFHDDCSFDGSSQFSDIIQSTDIADLKELIEKHRLIVAHNFINKLDGCLFNRPKYGVYNILFDNRKGNDEIPEVKIEFFDTDYFTHRVFRSIYKELKSSNHPISNLSQEELKQGLKKYNAFTTSLGINAFVISDSKHGESVIFSRRSSGAAHLENKFKYNSTVMEGISQTDFDSYENKVSLEQAINRAMKEELGLSKDHLSKYNTKINYCDFFLEMNYFEIGMTAVVIIDAIFEESIRDLPGQDRELEISKLHPVPKRKRELEKFIQNEEFYPQGLFTLKMLLARDLIFLNIKK